MSPNLTYAQPIFGNMTSFGEYLNSISYDLWGLSVLICVFGVFFLWGSRRGLITGYTTASFFSLLAAITLSIVGWMGTPPILITLSMLLIGTFLLYFGGTKGGL